MSAAIVERFVTANFDAPPPFSLKCKWFVLLVFAVMLAVAGCGDEQSEPASAGHAWINPPLSSDDKSVVLPAWLVYRVHGDARSEAVKALETEPYIQLSPAMAIHYTGTEVRVPAEMRPFLVRAVGNDTSAIEVVQSLTGLWMKTTLAAGDALGHQPLVVLVDPTPRDIFVTAE